MRLATLQLGDGYEPAVVVGERIVGLRGAGRGWPTTTRELVTLPREELAEIAAWVGQVAGRQAVPLVEVRLGPPLPEPGAILTIGDNYPPSDAAIGERPEHPLVFAKLPAAVIGPDALIGAIVPVTIVATAPNSLFGTLADHPARSVA